MTFRSPFGARCARDAFTLIEVLIATAIFAIILAAMDITFSGALRLQSATTKLTEDMVPSNHAVSVIEADLRGILVPGGVLAGPMTGLAQGIGNSQLQIFTTTGVIDDQQPVGAVQPQALTTMPRQPWGDIQQVTYYLRDSLGQSRAAGKDLVRGITRNLLTSGQPDLREQPLVSGVGSLTITYYDGMNWIDTWNSTNESVAVPQAIKVMVQFAAPNPGGPGRMPIQIVVPLDMQPGTNSTSGTSGTTSGGTTGGGR